jgi:hypothetical protein
MAIWFYINYNVSGIFTRKAPYSLGVINSSILKSLQNCIDKKNIFDHSIFIYMHPYIITLIKEFKLNANNKIALEQSAYMRNQFPFFGIKTTERRALQQAFLAKEMLPDKKEIEEIISTL